MFRPPKQSSTAEAYAVFSSISCDLRYTIPVLFDIDKYILVKLDSCVSLETDLDSSIISFLYPTLD